MGGVSKRNWTKMKRNSLSLVNTIVADCTVKMAFRLKWQKSETKWQTLRVSFLNSHILWKHKMQNDYQSSGQSVCLKSCFEFKLNLKVKGVSSWISF